MKASNSSRLWVLLGALAVIIVSGLFVGMSVYGKESATTPHRILTYAKLTELDPYRFDKIVPVMKGAIVDVGKVTNLSTGETFDSGDVLEDGYYTPHGEEVGLSFNPGESSFVLNEFWYDAVWSVKLYPKTLDARTLLSVGDVPDENMPDVWFEESAPGPPKLGKSEEDLRTENEIRRSSPKNILRGEVWYEIVHISGFSLDGRGEYCVRTEAGSTDSPGPFVDSIPVENSRKTPSANLAHKGERF